MLPPPPKPTLYRVSIDVRFINFFPIEAQDKMALDVHKIVLKCLVWWTGLSAEACTQICRSGILTNLANLLRIFVNLGINDKVRYNIVIY